MIIARLSYLYRGKRSTVERELADRSDLGEAISDLDRCGYDDITLVSVVVIVPDDPLAFEI